MDFINLVSIGTFENMKHFLLATFAILGWISLKRDACRGGGGGQVCTVRFWLSMLSVHLSFQKKKNQWVLGIK